MAMKARFALLLVDMVMMLLFFLALVVNVSRRVIDLFKDWFTPNQPG
jgi:hypothetical protein